MTQPPLAQARNGKAAERIKRSSSDFYNGVRRRKPAAVRWKLSPAQTVDAKDAAADALAVPAGHWWAADIDPLGKTAYRWGPIPSDENSRKKVERIVSRAITARCRDARLSVLSCETEGDASPSDGWDGEAWKVARKTVFKGLAAAAVVRFDRPRPHIRLFHDANSPIEDIASGKPSGARRIGDMEGTIERPQDAEGGIE